VHPAKMGRLRMVECRSLGAFTETTVITVRDASHRNRSGGSRCATIPTPT
jgi:hypothetical protein